MWWRHEKQKASIGPFLRFGHINNCWNGSVLYIIPGEPNYAYPPVLIYRHYLNIPHSGKEDELMSASLKPVVVEGTFILIQGHLLQVVKVKKEQWCFWRFNLKLALDKIYSKTIRYFVMETVTDPDFLVDQPKSKGPSISFLFQNFPNPYRFKIPALEASLSWAFYDVNHCPLKMGMDNNLDLLVSIGTISTRGLFSCSTINAWVEYGSRLAKKKEKNTRFIQSQFTHYPFNQECKVQVVDFLFQRFVEYFKKNSILFASIPHITQWKYFDILEGFGNFPNQVQNSSVIKGIHDIHLQLYLLFHHHTCPDRMFNQDLIEHNPEMFGSASNHFFLKPLNSSIAILGMDIHVVKNQEMWNLLQKTIHQNPLINHLIILQPSPVVWPSIFLAEASLISNKILEKRSFMKQVIQDCIPLFGVINQLFGSEDPQWMDSTLDHWNSRNSIVYQKSFIEWTQNLVQRVVLLSTNDIASGMTKLETMNLSNDLQIFDKRLMYNFVVKSDTIHSKGLLQLLQFSSRLNDLISLDKGLKYGFYQPKDRIQIIEQILNHCNDRERNKLKQTMSNIKSDALKQDFESAILYLLCNSEASHFRSSVLPCLSSFLNIDQYTNTCFLPLFEGGLKSKFSSLPIWFQVQSVHHLDQYCLSVSCRSLENKELHSVIIPPLLVEDAHHVPFPDLITEEDPVQDSSCFGFTFR